MSQNFNSHDVVVPHETSFTHYVHSRDQHVVRRSLLFSFGCDVPLLRKGLEWAESEAARPEGQWNQGAWAKNLTMGSLLEDPDPLVDKDWQIYSLEVNCQTAFCFAGNICHLSGDTFVSSGFRNDANPFAGMVSNVIPAGDGNGLSELMSIEIRARQLLRVSRTASTILFDENNSIENIRVLCEAIAGEEL